MTGMIQALRARLDGQRPGQSLVILAASLTVLMGMTALSVDAGNLWLQQRLLQNLADGAALVGAQEYNNTDPASPRLGDMGPVSALAYVQRGGIACTLGVTGPGPDCAINCTVFAADPVCNDEVLLPPDPRQYIQVEVSRTVSFAFARILGFNQQRLTARATARIVRQTPSGAAIIALGASGRLDCNGSIRGVSVCGGDANDLYRVTGDVVSYSTINGVPSIGTIYIEDGGAIATTGITANVFPSPGLVDPGTPGRYPDPIPDEMDAIGATFPSMSPPQYCPQRQWTDVVNGTTYLHQRGGLVDVDDTTPNTIHVLHPGFYCSIKFACGVAQFDEDGDANYPSPGYNYPAGVYIVNENFTSLPATTTLPLPGCTRSPDVELSMRLDKAVSKGIYIQTRYETVLLDETHFDLKGRGQYLDILFHSDAAGVGGFGIGLDNTWPSQAIGSIYAPYGRVTIRGNACDTSCGGTARVTRSQSCFGCPSLTERGGRVIGRHVELILDPSINGNSWGVDFPPYTTQLGLVPVLVPNP